jgi:ABC-2 type transport system ATP-binding protein
MKVIEVHHLTKRFGKFTAVDHISFTVDKGEVFGFLGPNGAGKSTTIRMLCTLLRPTEGSARIVGFDILREPARVREHIGLVTEKIILYERLTARENLTLFGRLNHLPDTVIREQISRWLRLLQMEEWQDHLVGTFSTGMKQRVNIARALLHQPEVLFLDEPTLGLDPQTTRSIREFIRQLSQEGITIVLTTHIMVEADLLCHRVGIIDHGRIVALDTPDNLKRIVSQSDTTVLDIEVANPSETLTTRIRNLECIISLTQKDTRRFRIHARGQNALNEVIDALRLNGGQIRAIASVEPTLEDVFLHLTGREMRDEASEKIPSLTKHRWAKPTSRIR